MYMETVLEEIMSKTKYRKLLTAFCLAAVLLIGCAGSRAQEPGSSADTTVSQSSTVDRIKDESAAESQRDHEEKTVLPPYVYTGDDPVMAGISQYFVSQKQDVLGGTVYIPVPVILKTEELEQEVLIYGVFWSFWYEQQEDTLFCVRGGGETGRIRMIRKDSGLTVSGFEKVRDGGDFLGI